jgi:hypothetical protein
VGRQAAENHAPMIPMSEMGTHLESVYGKLAARTILHKLRLPGNFRKFTPQLRMWARPHKAMLWRGSQFFISMDLAPALCNAQK